MIQSLISLSSMKLIEVRFPRYLANSSFLLILDIEAKKERSRHNTRTLFPKVMSLPMAFMFPTMSISLAQ